MNKSDAGRLGGTVTLERYGRDQLAEWGKLGGRPRSMTYDDITRRRRLEQNNNHEEVKGLPGSLTNLKKLYDARCRSSGGNGTTQAGIAQNTPTGQSLPERERL